MKADELRRSFISYFERQGHEHRPSGPLVPADDPTLMFTNAGMVQFKGIFTGETERPSPPRAVTSQKCLRVSGKHNDLEEVGRTARHHTFFEMLGNFSFGDYFKRDAIDFAWEWVTEDLGLEPGRLWATVHHDDDDAFNLWLERTAIPESRIRRMGDKDNFWQMGDTGPCGPCSELHYDLRTDRDDRITDAQFEAAGEADQIIEFWNLVFMQFDRAPDGTDTPLPAPSIDTGAGLERIAALLQGVGTNYHTDLFLPIIEAAEEGLGIEYSRAPEDWDDGVAFRVLADHARAVAFLLADGVFPSNEKRGYVLRRILRRAVRHYWLLGRRDPLLHDLVGVVADRMSATFPELEARREHLLSTTRAEEELFLSTIEGGMREIDRAMPDGGSGTVAGDVAFKLKDTYGIPEDLTGLIARERGYGVDWQGFDEALEAQRTRSRGAAESTGATAAVGFGGGLTIIASGADAKQEFVGYGDLEIETDCRRWAADGRHAFLLERNPFYLESGGQVSDTGRVVGDGWAVDISEIWDDGGRTVVAGALAEGALSEAEGVEDTVLAQVDPARRETERNHTATHLLHAALRNRLGEHVQQAGSLVAPDRLRFDFSHRGPLTPEERADIEAEVTEAILGNHDVDASQRDYDEAIAAGAMALFGEKYGDVVRVIEVPGLSLELCGGTHVRTTGQVGTFRIVSETGVAAGIRRIEAVTGQGAYRRELERDRLLTELAARLRCQPADLALRMDRLLEERDALAEEVRGQRGDAAERQLETLLAGAGAADANGARFVSGRLEVPAGTDLGALGDRLRGGMGSGAAVVHVVFADEDRHAFISVVSDDLIRLGVKAGDLVRVSSRATGSGGGGGARFAQGGVGDPSRTEDGLGAARAWASERVPALSGG